MRLKMKTKNKDLLLDVVIAIAKILVGRIKK